NRTRDTLILGNSMAISNCQQFATFLGELFPSVKHLVIYSFQLAPRSDGGEFFELVHLIPYLLKRWNQNLISLTLSTLPSNPKVQHQVLSLLDSAISLRHLYLYGIGGF